MARGKGVTYHATQRTETINPGPEYEFRQGFSYCDPKHTKRIPGDFHNRYQERIGVHTKADQSEEDLFKTDCPECAKRWGKAQLDALGDRVLVEKIENYSGYVKSTYRVSLDGGVRGYVTIANGWGEKWRIHRVAHDRTTRASFGNTDEPVGSVIDSNLIKRLHKSSLAGLASLFPALVAEGTLPTPAEQQAIDAADAEKRRLYKEESDARIEKARQERERATAELAERKTLAREALEAVSARADALGLSNSETMGLVEALKLIG